MEQGRALPRWPLPSVMLDPTPSKIHPRGQGVFPAYSCLAAGFPVQMEVRVLSFAVSIQSAIVRNIATPSRVAYILMLWQKELVQQLVHLQQSFAAEPQFCLVNLH